MIAERHRLYSFLFQLLLLVLPVACSFARMWLRVVVALRAGMSRQLTSLVLRAGHRLKRRFVHAIQAILIDLLP